MGAADKGNKSGAKKKHMEKKDNTGQKGHKQSAGDDDLFSFDDDVFQKDFKEYLTDEELAPHRRRHWSTRWSLCSKNFCSTLALVLSSLLMIAAYWPTENGDILQLIRVGNVRSVRRAVRTHMQETGKSHIDEIMMSHNRTVTHAALQFNHTHLLAFALRQGADPNAIMEGNRSPLHLATIYGNAEQVSMLLQAGADKDATMDYR